MNLEDRINKIIQSSIFWMPIGLWDVNFVKDILNPRDDKRYVKAIKAINLEIESASLAECLTSPSEYIREYKKQTMENKNESI